MSGVEEGGDASLDLGLVTAWAWPSLLNFDLGKLWLFLAHAKM